jgi:hypothetical protein
MACRIGMTEIVGDIILGVLYEPHHQWTSS